MTLPFTTFPIPTALLDTAAITATNTTVANTLANRFGGSSTYISVKDFGAKGDGSTDDLAALTTAFATVFPNSTGSTPVPNLGILYFPPGNYKISAPIPVTGMVGGRVVGAHRLAVQITNTGTGSCIVTNGCAYTRWEGISFWPGTLGIGFDLDWNGSASHFSLQSNTFADCLFQAGAIGMRIGQSNNMGSENLLLNCFFSSCTTAGLKVVNANALQNSVVGGDFQSCTNFGIWVANGSVPNILGCGFQNFSNTYDIQVDNSSTDCYQISGCRSESVNFANFPRGVAVISGALHTGAGGTFVNLGVHSVTLINSASWTGQLAGNNGSNKGQFDIISCEFGNTHWAIGGSGNDAIGRIRNSIVGGLLDLGTGSYVSDSMFRGNGTDSGLVNNGLREVVGSGNSANGYSTTSVGNNNSSLGFIQQKTRGTNYTSQTIVQSGDSLGNFFFQGSDGAAMQGAAQMDVQVDGTPGAGSMPGRWVCYTTPTGSTTPLERWRTDNKGNFVINTGAINVNSTDGFLYLESCAGTPNGTPTSYTGRVPVIVDTSAGKLWAYYGGAWHFTTFT